MGIRVVNTYWFNYEMSCVDGPVNWRLPMACQMIFCADCGGVGFWVCLAGMNPTIEALIQEYRKH